MTSHTNADYSELFDDDLRAMLGVFMWRIDNFTPMLLEEESNGHFYSKDCYIVLNADETEDGDATFCIFYWIGNDSSIDKRACAAIHAVHLREHLGVSCQVVRNEQDDVCDEFLQCFDTPIRIVEG